MEDQAEEIRRLRGFINDLISLLTLPAMWRGREPSQVVGILLDVLLSLLRLDFVYIQVKVGAGGSSIEAVRVARDQKVNCEPLEVDRALQEWVTLHALDSDCRVPNPVGEGEVSIAHFWLGPENDMGVIVAASRRAEFPIDDETLLLKFAVNQALIELQQQQILAERSQAEEARRKTDERFGVLITQATAGIAQVDLDGVFTLVSDRYCQLTRYSRADLIGRRGIQNIMHMDDLADNLDLVQLILRDRRSFETAKRYVRKDGTTAWVDHSTSPVHDANGKQIAMMVVAVDITGRKQAEEALHCAHAELEQRVSERTSQPAAVNEGLTREVIERKQAEEKLTASSEEIKLLKGGLIHTKLYREEEIRTEQGFEGIIGKSKAIRHMLGQIEKVAPTDSTVLIQGETGSGKELLARAIHRLSRRRDRTFVKINCAAIPSGLLESELFGHEKGAFTGAVAQKIGRFEVAQRGTLFLDEVGEIPLELQVKLLRVLQEQEFERLGSIRTIRVDIRLVAATNRDLKQMVADREFREDLYYRINVFPVEVPPLRERTEDIPQLVRHFTRKHAHQINKSIITIPTEVMDALCQWTWPGNIRELENFLERCVILSSSEDLEAPLSELHSVASASTFPITLQDAEREHIRQALLACRWVIAGPSGAAAKLGMKRTSLQYKMQKLGIARP
jgi:PAS domain S-box-containing protein